MSESAALEQLLGQHGPRMATVAWRVLRDADRAEDALQDALLHIWKRRRTVLAHPNPSALLQKMCFQSAIDHYRCHARQRPAPLPIGLASDQPSQLDHAVSDETRGRVLAGIAQLPAQQGEAIYLRVIEQLDYDAVAAALGCEPSTARAHVRRARESLRKTLIDLMPKEACHER